MKRAITISPANIIEIKAENDTTVNATRYYEIVVLATGEKKSWLAKHSAPASWSTENDVKVFNTGGKRITVATDIKGESEAQWLLAQLRGALRVSV